MSNLNNRELANRNYLKEKKPYVYEKIQKFDEKLRKGEPVGIIQFQYNFKCNFRCEHCSVKRFQGKNDRRSFTAEDVKDLARQADELGLARFVITGGEPMTFQDFDDVVAAIDPQKFYINCDSNGWYLTKEKIQHLKDIGVDRIQLSLDSLNAEEHDAFRHAPGSHARAMAAVDYAKEIGMDIYIQTVVTKERLYSDEFIRFIEFFNNKGVGVFVSYAKPVGAWEGCFDNLITKDDFEYMHKLEKKYRVYTHLTPAYGLNMGCIAIKGMFTVTQYGDVLPCPYIHISIGNVFEEPLKDILERGLNIKFFGEHVNTCLIAEDRNFIHNYVEKNVYGKPLPVSYKDVFTADDKTKVPFNESEDFFVKPE